MRKFILCLIMSIMFFSSQTGFSAERTVLIEMQTAVW